MQTQHETMMRLQKQLESMLNTASDILAAHSSESKWRMKKLILWLDFAFKSTGFKIDGRATLVTDIECSGGWAGEDLNLCKGKQGRVADIDIMESGEVFVAFVPDDQVWMPKESFPEQGLVKGVPQLKGHSHSFLLPASKLKPEVAS